MISPMFVASMLFLLGLASSVCVLFYGSHKRTAVHFAARLVFYMSWPSVLVLFLSQA